MSLHSPGKAFRAALTKENPLQIVGTINANHALLAQRAGYQAIYLSGGGVAAGSLTDPARTNFHKLPAMSSMVYCFCAVSNLPVSIHAF